MKSYGGIIWLASSLFLSIGAQLALDLDFGPSRYVTANRIFGSTMLSPFVFCFTFLVYRSIAWYRKPREQRKAPFVLMASSLGISLLVNTVATGILFTAPIFPSEADPFGGSGSYAGFVPLLIAFATVIGTLILSLILSLIRLGSMKKGNENTPPSEILDADELES